MTSLDRVLLLGSFNAWAFRLFYYGPLVMSILVVGYMWLEKESSSRKLLATLVAGAAAAIQFSVLRYDTSYFMIPVALQLSLCAWWFFTHRV